MRTLGTRCGDPGSYFNPQSYCPLDKLTAEQINHLEPPTSSVIVVIMSLSLLTAYTGTQASPRPHETLRMQGCPYWRSQLDLLKIATRPRHKLCSNLAPSIGGQMAAGAFTNQPSIGPFRSTNSHTKVNLVSKKRHLSTVVAVASSLRVSLLGGNNRAHPPGIVHCASTITRFARPSFGGWPSARPADDRRALRCSRSSGYPILDAIRCTVAPSATLSSHFGSVPVSSSSLIPDCRSHHHFVTFLAYNSCCAAEPSPRAHM